MVLAAVAAFSIVDHDHQPICRYNFAVVMGELVAASFESKRVGVRSDDVGDLIEVIGARIVAQAREQHACDFSQGYLG